MFGRQGVRNFRELVYDLKINLLHRFENKAIESNS